MRCTNSQPCRHVVRIVGAALKLRHTDVSLPLSHRFACAAARTRRAQPRAVINSGFSEAWRDNANSLMISGKSDRIDLSMRCQEARRHATCGRWAKNHRRGRRAFSALSFQPATVRLLGAGPPNCHAPFGWTQSTPPCKTTTVSADPEKYKDLGRTFPYIFGKPPPCLRALNLQTAAAPFGRWTSKPPPCALWALDITDRRKNSNMTGEVLGDQSVVSTP